MRLKKKDHARIVVPDAQWYGARVRIDVREAYVFENFRRDRGGG
jgi:hypothetical protein